MHPDAVIGAEFATRLDLGRWRTNLANVPAVWEGTKHSMRHLKHLGWGGGGGVCPLLALKKL